MGLGKKSLAEGLGTAFLLAVVVGSGVMAERLAAGNHALALLANAIATGAGLCALILIFADLSGAQFNPAVSLAKTLRGEQSAGETFAYAVVQLAGAMLGVAAAHAMFDLPAYATSPHARTGFPQVLSEGIATFGLVLVVLRVPRHGTMATALAVGAYIAAAYWFTASTSFANPAVTIARAFTPTFSGIEPSSVPAFVMAQAVSATIAALLSKWFDGPEPVVPG